MKVIFQARSFTPCLQPAGLRFKVQRYKHAAKGGPKSATIQAEGEEADLWQLLDYLRRPVEIYADEGDAVWWGCLYELQLNFKGYTIKAGLGDMANRAAVAFELVNAGSENGIRQTTDWVQNDASAAEYGRKELLESYTGSTLIGAETARDKLLAARKIPVMAIDPNPGGEENTAILTCVGWWDTLEWLYAPVPLSLAYAYETANADLELGKTITRIAQAIDVQSTAINAASIEIRVRKVGAPTDNLTVSIYTNPDDLTPTTELVASDSVDGAGLGTDYAWTLFTLSSPQSLAPGTYFIMVDRSGALDASNYYQVQIDSGAGYDLGPLRKEAGGSWSAVTGDMAFRVYTNDIIETSQQVRSLITAYGQFFRSTALEVDSGISTESYRDGDGDALYEVDQLLEMGTSNNRRMLASVDISRRVRIYEEPDDSEPYLLTRDFTITDRFGAPIRKATCPVGIWAMPSGILPRSVESLLVNSPQMMFIEEAEYDVVADKPTLTPRGVKSPYDMGPRDG